MIAKFNIMYIAIKNCAQTIIDSSFVIFFSTNCIYYSQIICTHNCTNILCRKVYDIMFLLNLFKRRRSNNICIYKFYSNF